MAETDVHETERAEDDDEKEKEKEKEKVTAKSTSDEREQRTQQCCRVHTVKDSTVFVGQKEHF